MVKSDGAQRKSDGVVVPPIVVQHNTAGGKGPDFGEDASLCSRPTSEISSVRSIMIVSWAWSNGGSDRRVLKLVRQWLGAGVLINGVRSETVTGTPQGGVISPLLANIFLHAFDRAWAECGTGELVRYADDFVVLCSTRSQAEQAGHLACEVLGELGLELHPDKTRVVDLREGKEGFDFLGCHLHARMSGRLWERGISRYYLHRWPSQRSMKRARQRIKDLTGRNRTGSELQDVISDLNLFLRGWGNNFRTGNASTKFVQLDRHVTWRLRRLLIKKRGRNLRAGQAGRWTPAWFHDQGLHRLSGTIRYPKAA
jgi:RNA-directed DNA polymerase